MERKPVNIQKQTVILVYDDADEDEAKRIILYLTQKEINCEVVYEFPGKNILDIILENVNLVSKIIFLRTQAFVKNNILNHYFLAILANKTISTRKLITLTDPYLQLPDFRPGSMVILLGSSSTWLEDLVYLIKIKLPRYWHIYSIKAENFLHCLLFQGLSRQHLEYNVLGVFASVRRLLLQLDIGEFMAHRKNHQIYKTSTAFQELPGLHDINASFELVIKESTGHKMDDSVLNLLEDCSNDIAELSAVVIDSYVELPPDLDDLKGYSFSVACTVEGKYGQKEKKALSIIFPKVCNVLLNKHAASRDTPVLPRLNDVKEREKTFDNEFKSRKAVEKICDAGFYNAGFADAGRCFYCGCTLTNIEIHDEPLLKHASRWPECHFIKRKLTEHEIKEAVKIFNSDKEKIRQSEAIKQKYKCKTKRVKSFDLLLKNVETLDLDIEKLAEAGFFYTGYDQERVVQCFTCNLRLFDVSCDPSPWVLHARFSASCPYLIQEKGAEFIEAVQFGNEGSTIITFLRKTWDGTKRRKWPKNIFRPW